MEIRRHRMVPALVVLLACSYVALTLPDELPGQAAPSNSITIGKIDSVWSTTLKEQRKIWIYTPPSYNDTVYLPRKYPVLYLLDGIAHFHSVTGLIQYLGPGLVVPEMIVVAIPNTDRTRDLTPTHVEKDSQGKPSPFLKNTGGMGNFFQFLKTELLPKIDSAYRTAPYRVFVGHSYGGIATINALYTMPETFNAYVAIDPSLWYDDRVLLRKAKAYFGKPGLAGRTLFVGQANTFAANDTAFNMHSYAIAQFNAVLESHNQSGIRYGYKHYPSDTHGSVPLIATYDALRFIFADYQPNFQLVSDRPGYLRDHFAKVSAGLGYQVLPLEAVVDFLGRSSLMTDTTKAIALFQMNTELYPTSPKAFASLGDAWRARGDVKKAMAAYEKSLALKPNNPYVKDMIEKLKAGKE